MRRTISLSALLMGISFLMIQCSKSVDPLEPTSKILFNREGGGSKEFYVTTNSSHDIIANVIRYDFRDTNYTTTVFAEDSGRLSNLISNIMDNKVTITGDFHQSTKPTGTWAYLYVVSVNNTLTEITNTSVRDSLMKLEMMVENAG